MVLKLLGGCVIICLFIPILSIAQDTPDFYISNQGKDIYPGTSPLLPRKTITSTAPLLTNFASVKGSVKVALQSGNIFDESLVTSYPVEVKTYPDENGNTDFAILDGSKEFSTGWVKDSGASYTYKQEIPYKGFTGGGIVGIESYSYIYVTEIDKALEKTAPFTSRKVLTFFNSPELVEKTPGSFYSSINTAENPRLMYIHTSNGSSPNSNEKYRYEVTVRDWGVNSTNQSGNVFENLWVHGFGAGNGMLPGGDNSTYNKIIFGPGAGIHHLTVRSGTIDHSLFLPSAKNTSRFAVVFYDAEGLGRHCIIKNSIFLDVPAPMYMHTSGSGTRYGGLEIDNTVAFADSTNVRPFTYTSDNDTVLLNNVYTDGFSRGYNFGTAKYAAITNCYFKDVTSFGVGYGTVNPVNSVVKNCFIKTKTASFITGIYVQAGTSLHLTNTIVHISNTAASNSSFIYGCGATGSKITVTGNIFIGDNIPSATLVAASIITGNGIYASKDKWDNNVYILLQGQGIVWNVTVAGPNGTIKKADNFDEWKKQTGQDQHSLFFDLRNDPRGLQAIFINPASGDYELADTPEGNQIAALGAGMTSPITCFIKRPTYEEAADMIRNNLVLSINGCRNPCYQHTLRVNNTLTIKATNTNKVTVRWNIAEQQNIGHYELQKTTVNSVFRRIAIIPAGEDSAYSFNDDDIKPGILYQYRLLVVARAGNGCYSDVKSVKFNNDRPFIIYPNPSTGKLWIYMNTYLGKVYYTILNSSGQAIIKSEYFSLYTPHGLDLTQQPNGIYFIKIETTNGASIQKFVKE
jgi:hypothetical protein